MTVLQFSAEPQRALPPARFPLIEMEGVGKPYGNIRAIEGINLRVDAGEITCVLGDNGAGKSTLIKIMAGLHQHSEGVVRVDGETDLRVAAGGTGPGIATVYQDLAVVSLMEVWRNFFLGPEKRKVRSRHPSDSDACAARRRRNWRRWASSWPT